MPKRIKPPVRWQYDPWARFSAAVLTQAVADANRGDAEAALWLCEPSVFHSYSDLDPGTFRRHMSPQGEFIL
jgi:uncharacterized cupin superfamily protein